MQEPRNLPKEEQWLSLVSRVSLKHTLFLKRGMLTSRGWRPICAYCGEPIMEEPEMHEAILSKGNVQGNFLAEEAINTEENCVLTHPGGKNLDSCHSKLHTKLGRERAIRHLLRYVTREKIIAWLDRMSGILRSETVYERMQEVIAMDITMTAERWQMTSTSRPPLPE